MDASSYSIGSPSARQQSFDTHDLVGLLEFESAVHVVAVASITIVGVTVD